MTMNYDAWRGGRWGGSGTQSGNATTNEGSTQKTGDPFIDNWVEQGGTWSIGADGSLILSRPATRYEDASVQRIPGYFPDPKGGSSDRAPSYPPAHADPRYWELQQKELEALYMRMGLDRDTARQRALTDLIQSRNNLSGDVAGISAGVAKTAAEFAANPRDAVAELMYKNQVGGSTPFGDMTNDAFGQYGTALAEKAASIFQPVAGDLNKAREYRDAIPLPEFLGATTAAPAPAAAQNPNALQSLVDRLNSFNPQQKDDFIKWVTAANGGVQPTTAEDGVNMNIMEPAMVVGQSGRIYATLSEKDPEELIVKPLPTTKERKKNESAANKSFMQATQGAQRMQDGGTITAGGSPDDFMQQLRQYLGSLGGSGGGVGKSSSPLPDIRRLAGAPWQALLDDPVGMDHALAGYSALGIDPRTVESTVRKFTPRSPINNSPRISWAG